MKAPDAATLIRLQLELECIGLTGNGRLYRNPGPDPDDIALAYFFKFPDGTHLIYFRDDLPESKAKPLLEMNIKDAFLDGLQCVEMAGGSACECFSSYCIDGDGIALSDELTKTGNGKVRAELKRDGKVVAFCESVRENGSAAEAWAFVEPAFRRQGLARQVVQAWAGLVLAAGKIPFYSHKRENHASAALAASLKLVQFADVMTILD